MSGEDSRRATRPTGDRVMKRPRWHRRLNRTFALSMAVLASPLVLVGATNALNALDRHRQEQTILTLRTLATAVDLHSRTHGGHPHLGADPIPATRLASLLTPTDGERLRFHDGWGRPLLYRSEGTGYRLWSHGKDGRFGGPSGTPSRGAVTSFEDDLVLANGSFLAWPEGP